METNRTVKCIDLSVGYSGKSIQENINLSAGESETVAVIGANGSGKSTLLRTLVGILSGVAGDLQILGSSIESYSQAERAKILSFVSTSNISNRYMSVEELVMLGRYPHTGYRGRLTTKDRLIVEEAMQTVGISHLRRAFISEISDGERQKVSIAGALSQDTPLMILDEPISFLDPENTYSILGILAHLAQKKQKTIIYSTHDIPTAVNQADKIWMFKNNHILEGAPEDFILKNSFEDLFLMPGFSFDSQSGQYRKQQLFLYELFYINKGAEDDFVKSAVKAAGRVNCKLKAADNNSPVHCILHKNNTVSVIHSGNTSRCSSFYEFAGVLKQMNLKSEQAYRG